MIVREWRGKAETAAAEAYLDSLRGTALSDYAATPGHRGTLLLRSEVDGLTEFTLLTLWESEAVIAAFAGEDITTARIYSNCKPYLREYWTKARHYRVVSADFPPR